MTPEPQPIRRVVTGNDEYGRSCVLFDSAAPNVNPGAISRGTCMTDVWVYQTAPASDDGNLPFHFEPPAAGGHLRIVSRTSNPPTTTRRRIRRSNRSGRRGCVPTASGTAAGRNGSPRRCTNPATVDYGILLKGERTLLLDRGNVTMKAGDVVVQLGNWHGWTNVNERSLMVFVMMGATFAQEQKV
ncbi:MAG: hypothetical protein WBE90_04505 [Xanthobacteraceae bacterium]